MSRYNKPALSVDDQLDFLQAKGLQFTSKEKARNYLQRVGFFRLKPYRVSFYQPGSDSFQDDTYFDDILNLYIFDRKLRVLFVDALERIEVAVRSSISNVMSEAKGPHWYLDEDNFHPAYVSKRFNGFVSKVEAQTGKGCPDRRNPSCSFYYDKYSSPGTPPSWVVAEVLSMSTWSMLYSGLRKTKYKKRISSSFRFDKNDFGAWVHALSMLRNICAHYDILWNRALPQRAKNVANYSYQGVSLTKPYTNLVLVYSFLRSFIPTTTWNRRIMGLLNDAQKESPLDLYSLMGFPENWTSIPFWNLVRTK